MYEIVLVPIYLGKHYIDVFYMDNNNTLDISKTKRMINKKEKKYRIT